MEKTGKQKEEKEEEKEEKGKRRREQKRTKKRDNRTLFRKNLSTAPPSTTAPSFTLSDAIIEANSFRCWSERSTFSNILPKSTARKRGFEASLDGDCCPSLSFSLSSPLFSADPSLLEKRLADQFALELRTVAIASTVHDSSFLTLLHKTLRKRGRRQLLTSSWRRRQPEWKSSQWLSHC